MAGRRANRFPRCPVCATLLTTDRTIEEQWVRRDPGPDLWVYRLTCSKCLTIARVEVPEISALVRSEPSAAGVDVAGSVVARVLERLRASSTAAEIAAVLADAIADPERRVLLRIPEVLAASRSVLAGGVRLAEDLVLNWPALTEYATRPEGRMTLQRPFRALSEEPVVIAGEALELRLRVGREMAVAGFDGGTVLLVPPHDEPELAWWLEDVEVLVAWADFVAPRE